MARDLNSECMYRYVHVCIYSQPIPILRSMHWLSAIFALSEAIDYGIPCHHVVYLGATEQWGTKVSLNGRKVESRAIPGG